VKIATFNINNINRRLPNLLDWLKSAKPDVVCLQELKAEQDQFPEKPLQRAGYAAVWAGQKTRNGVAILAHKNIPVLTRTALPGDPQDHQSRYIEAAVAGVLIACVYAPNGNPYPGPKFDYKLAWMKRLHKHAVKLLKANAPVVIAGDFNVAPTPLDIYPTKSWDKDALIQPESRKAYSQLISQGWTDSVRTMHAEKRIYTFWTYWRNRYERDDGLRLDHLLLSPELARRLRKTGVDSVIRGKENASDHAPAWVLLK
jgi:exodeoxyribonuclease III